MAHTPPPDVTARAVAVAAPFEEALRRLAPGPHASREPALSAVTGRPTAWVPVSTPADAVRATASAGAARARPGALRAGRRSVVPRLLTTSPVRRAALASALRHGGLAPADAAAELRLADAFAARCLRAARHHLPPASSVPAVVTSYADPTRPLLSLLEGALPALLAGSAVTTVVDVPTAVVAALAAEAVGEAGLPEGVWQLLAARPADASGVYAALAEHAVGLAPQCCPPPCRPRRPGLLAVRHDGDARAAARAVLAGLTARGGRTCAATPVVAVHTARWREFHAELTVGARSLPAGAALRAERGLDRVRPAEITAGPVAVVAPYTAWAEVLHLARETGAHAAVFTRARTGRLAPQFDALPATRPVLNDRPRPGLSPREAFRELPRRPGRSGG